MKMDECLVKIGSEPWSGVHIHIDSTSGLIPAYCFCSLIRMVRNWPFVMLAVDAALLLFCNTHIIVD